MASEPIQNNSSFYDRISHAYDLIADSGEHKARETGEELLNLAVGETILEIGFGTGNSLIKFAKQVGPSGAVYGTDVSAGMLAVAQKKIDSQKGVTNVQLQVGDARKLSYPNDTFDVVFASFTLELFPLEDIPAVLAEIKRVLKPGGRLGIVSMATVLESEQESVLEKTYVWMHQHFPHIVDCQPIDVKQLTTSAGFEIDKCEEIEIWTMPVRAVVAKA